METQRSGGLRTWIALGGLLAVLLPPLGVGAETFQIVPGRIQTGSASAVGPLNFKYPDETVFDTIVSEGPGPNEMTILLDGFFVPGGPDVGTEYQFALPIVLPNSLAELELLLGSPQDSETRSCVVAVYSDLLDESDPRIVTRLAPSDQLIGQCGISSMLWRNALTDSIALTLDKTSGEMFSEDIPMIAFLDQSGGAVRSQEFPMRLSTETLPTGPNPCSPFAGTIPGRPYDATSGEASLVFYSCLDDFDPNIVIRASLSYRLTGFPLPEPTSALGGLATLGALVGLRRRRRSS